MGGPPKPPLPPFLEGESAKDYVRRQTLAGGFQPPPPPVFQEPFFVYVDPPEKGPAKTDVPASLAFLAKHIKGIGAAVVVVASATFGLGATVGVYLRDMSKTLEDMKELASQDLATKDDLEMIAPQIQASIEWNLQNKTDVKANCPTITVKGLGWAPCSIVGLVPKTMEFPPALKLPRKPKKKPIDKTSKPAETRDD